MLHGQQLRKFDYFNYLASAMLIARMRRTGLLFLGVHLSISTFRHLRIVIVPVSLHSCIQRVAA